MIILEEVYSSIVIYATILIKRSSSL